MKTCIDASGLAVSITVFTSPIQMAPSNLGRWHLATEHRDHQLIGPCCAIMILVGLRKSRLPVSQKWWQEEFAAFISNSTIRKTRYWEPPLLMWSTSRFKVT